MFHTLAALKNGAGVAAEREPALRLVEERRIVAAADRLVAANAIERNGLVTACGADGARVAVIPCGVDTDLFTTGDPAAARAALGLDPGPLLLYVGRLARGRASEHRARRRHRPPRARGRPVRARRDDHARAGRRRAALAAGPRGPALGRAAPLAVRRRGGLPRVREPGRGRRRPGDGPLRVGPTRML